jgi:hypothetical protein
VPPSACAAVPAERVDRSLAGARDERRVPSEDRLAISPSARSSRACTVQKNGSARRSRNDQVWLETAMSGIRVLGDLPYTSCCRRDSAATRSGALDLALLCLREP